MIEIEKKYRLTKEQFEHVQEDLKEFEAEFIGEDFEENNLYGNEEFEEKKAVLRLRKIDEKTILTYKQWISNETGFKQQIEHETAVEDAKQIEEIIKYLGLFKGIVYEKRRKTWKFRDAEVVLDELPFGLFMEIEGSFTAIAEAEMFLDAETFEVENKTYSTLTLELGRKNGQLIEARF
jgi:adenylate cyclase class 2